MPLQIANLKNTDVDAQQARFEAWAAIQTGNVTTKEWRRCEARFGYFLRYVRIPDANKGLIPYEIWPYLLEIADDWQGGESWIEGKARQLGYSWLLAAYDVWIGTFRDYARVLSFSINQRESDELLQKVVHINDNLPEWIRVEFSEKRHDYVKWGATNAEMSALPSTGQAGRGYTATLVQTDEWAFHMNAAEHYSAYRSAIADGGQHIAVSTGNGTFNIFYRYFTSSSAAVPYRKRFNGWRARPGRDAAWLERERAAFLVEALNPDSDEFGKHPGLFKRENPETIDEMFEVFVGLVYDCFDRFVHVKGAVFTWQSAKYRVAGVDPGQGDPFAMGAFGESEGGHVHQFAEFYRQGVVSEDVAADWLMIWHRIAPFDGIYVDNIEGTLIATFQSRGLPAYPANKERRTGIGHVYGRLYARNFTIDPTCTSHIKEYQEYQWARVKKGQQEWATSTPEDHHGDGMDETRYALVGLAKGFEHAPSKEVAQPAWHRKSDVKTMVMPVPTVPGAVRDAGVKNAPARRGPNYARRGVGVPGLRSISGLRGR